MAQAINGKRSLEAIGTEVGLRVRDACVIDQNIKSAAFFLQSLFQIGGREPCSLHGDKIQSMEVNGSGSYVRRGLLVDPFRCFIEAIMLSREIRRTCVDSGSAQSQIDSRALSNALGSPGQVSSLRQRWSARYPTTTATLPVKSRNDARYCSSFILASLLRCHWEVGLHLLGRPETPSPPQCSYPPHA